MGNCPTCTEELSQRSLDPRCRGQRMWPVLFVISFTIYILGWIFLWIFDRLLYSSNSQRRGNHESSKLEKSSTKYSTTSDDADTSVSSSNGCGEGLQNLENRLVSGQTTMSKIFITINFLSNIAALILFCVDTKANPYTESCDNFRDSLIMKIDFGLNTVFAIYFILQFMIAQDKKKFWLSYYSIVDIFTIPPSLMSFYMQRTWIGFRCLRILLIMKIPDILQYMSIIQRTRTIRILRLATKLIATSFACAGIVHLAENSGDFFCNYCNNQEIDIFNAVYFMIVTMTTVGYGDISCKTYTGKAFVLISLVGGLTLFTTMLPEFHTLFNSKSSYFERYKTIQGRRHVIICGHITPHSLEAFLHDFLNKGREQAEKLDVVVLNRETPDIEMETLLKRYHTKLYYFVGGVMKVADLQRVQADKAAACLIIANKECTDAASDDSSNIMRVISIKNFNPHIRIVVQLLQYGNKLNVASIPSWNPDRDEIICIPELKLGLIGMSCIVPGFATMLTNIFRTSSYGIQAVQKQHGYCCTSTSSDIDNGDAWPWRSIYHRGAGMKMFLEQFSPYFIGLTFAEAALMCFKLGVMLLAVELQKEDQNGIKTLVVEVVPCDDCVIVSGNRAFILCMSSEEANRIKNYCSKCHPKINDLTKSQMKSIRRCTHATQNGKTTGALSTNVKIQRTDLNQQTVVCISDTDDVSIPLLVRNSTKSASRCWNRSETLLEGDISNFDSTGMLYYTDPRKIEEAVLDVNLLRNEDTTSFSDCFAEEDIPRKHPSKFQNHIVVCLHADESSPAIGLRNLILPLRASSFPQQELSTIVFVTDLNYMRREWHLISTFPDIYILDGSPTNPQNLKLVSIISCRQCIVMSTLDHIHMDLRLVDKVSVLCALTIRQIEMKQNGLSLTSPVQSRKDLRNMIRVNTITSLKIDSNVQFLEQGHTDEADLDFYLTTPFASGTAFSDSVMDCILSCAYYNNNTIKLLRVIFMGDLDSNLESKLSEGEHFMKCEAPEKLKKRKRARVRMLPIDDLIPRIDETNNRITFASLFCEALECHHMIVLGIYRLLSVLLKNDPHQDENKLNDNEKRIVIFYPPNNYHMHSSDMIYVMQHSHLKDD